MSDHIQIGDTSPRVQHVGDGAQTVFTYPFPIFKDADLEVYVDSTLNTLTTDYTVTGAGISSGGEVIFLSAPADQSAVTLVRRLTIQRTSDFQASGEFRAKVINDELDFQTASLQQIEDDLSRAIRLKRDDAASALELPLAVDRANKVIGFDADGNAQLSTLTLSEIETGATGPTGPAGPTGPQGADGMFSGSEATVTPALGDLMAIKDVSDADNPKFATLTTLLNAIDLLSDDGSNVDTAADWLLYFDASTGAAKKLNPEDLAGGGGLQSVQVFTSSGTWTKPAGITTVKVTVVGAGGGGGGGNSGSSAAGAGGGAGGCAIEVIDVTGTSAETITIGSGGPAGTGSSADGGSGGTSSFGIHCSATGGSGGGSSSGNTDEAGGAGGSGSGGDLNLTGGGGNGMSTGGSSNAHGGQGGSGVFGGEGAGNSNGNGNAGSNGGGGGGGGNSGSGSVNGGAGGSGIIIVEEYAS